MTGGRGRVARSERVQPDPADVFLVFDLFFSGGTDRVFLGLDVQVAFGERRAAIKRMGREPNLSRRRFLEVAVRNGRWVLTHVPAGPRPAPPSAKHNFPTEE